MKALYDTTSFQLSKVVTTSYSTSFSLAVKMLHRDMAAPIYSIYGFVRLADEIVDSFHDFNKKELLDRFIADTYRAIDEGISTNPILHSFQTTVNYYGIDRGLIDIFLQSMAMDLNPQKYDEKKFDNYIYGSAEVVGLMCLRVFCENDQEKYKLLYHDARKLGAAFQKINFLRDLHHDYKELGRVYFPDLNLENFDEDIKSKIEADIESDFADGLRGIRNLPIKSRLGVYLAYNYFFFLYKKIQITPANLILNQRVRIANFNKILIGCKAYFKYRLDSI